MLMVFVTCRETPEIELLFGVDCDKVDWLMIANVIVSKYILLWAIGRLVQLSQPYKSASSKNDTPLNQYHLHNFFVFIHIKCHCRVKRFYRQMKTDNESIYYECPQLLISASISIHKTLILIHPLSKKFPFLMVAKWFYGGTQHKVNL